MNDAIKAGVVGSFVGDALALGLHWIYDTDKIDKAYGRVETLLKPALVEYHLGKEAGEFTHYGDQAFELLVSVSTANAFDEENFMSRWRALFRGGYQGYFDHATKNILEQFGSCDSFKACSSHSSDLGGASRIAPLLVVYGHDSDALRIAARAQTILTHNNATVLEAAEFFAETAYYVLKGESPREAMQKAITAGSESRYTRISTMVKTGLESVDLPTREAIAQLGQGCAVDAALPSTVHLIAKYPDNFQEAMIENINAGGDSAARGMLAGMIIGARVGMNGIPSGWFEGLKRHEELMGFINQTRHIHYYEYTTHTEI